jgi:hypothetical protein
MVKKTLMFVGAMLLMWAFIWCGTAGVYLAISDCKPVIVQGNECQLETLRSTVRWQQLEIELLKRELNRNAEPDALADLSNSVASGR